MCSQAIEQNDFPKVLGTAQCSIARSQLHIILLSTWANGLYSGEIDNM